MIFRLFFIFVFIGSIYNSAISQEVKDFQKIYKQESIFRSQSFLSGNNYIKNGVEHSLGWTFGSMKKEFNPDEASGMLYLKARKDSRNSVILSIVGLATMFTGIFVVEPNTERNLGLGLGLIGAGLATSLTGTYFQVAGNQKLDRAIHMRNLDLLK
jgi:hypothetical protein